MNRPEYEWCPHCELEQAVIVKDNDYETVCPTCNKRLMLCTKCMRNQRISRGQFNCDYDVNTDKCFRCKEK